MLHRNGKEIEQIFRNGREIALLYRNGKIIYDKRGKGPVTKTFQDLIDEGYVTVSRTSPNGDSYSAGWVGRAVGLTVAANCPYTLDQITDFDDVFNSAKMVSFDGVVGEGKLPNAFLWPANHWLTDDEVYDLYNGVTLSHDVIGLQFKFLNWSNKDSVTIRYPQVGDDPSVVHGWYFTDSGIFGPNMPKTINFDVANRNFTSTHIMFGRHNTNYDNVYNGMQNTVTFNWITTVYGGSNNTTRDASGMFEDAIKLENVSGINISSAQNVSDIFHGCSAITNIPQTIAPSGMNSIIDIHNMFDGCTKLKSIAPVMNLQNVTNNSCAFRGCSSLTTIYLKNINSSKNQDLDLSDTNLNQDYADYIVANVYENVDTSADGFVYKNIYFPAGVTITQPQASRLYQYGWNCYVDGQLINPSEFHISYVNGETSEDITGSLPANETVRSTSYTIPTSDLAWNEHGLLGYSETQYPAYADIATSVYAPGSTITLDHDMTLYPVWNTTFKGLYDEGFVTVTEPEERNSVGSMQLVVSNNHYPKELVVDFNEVFMSQEGYKISTDASSRQTFYGGTKPNALVWNTTSHWLTNDEIYNLYNGVTLPHWPHPYQFMGVNVSEKDTFELKFNGPSNYSPGDKTSYAAFRSSGFNKLIVDVGSAQWYSMAGVFGKYVTGAQVKEVTMKANNNSYAKPTSLDAAFENCAIMTKLTGVSICGTRELGYAFDNCRKLSDIYAYEQNEETLSGINLNYTFRNCWNLRSIEPILNVSNTTENTGTFATTGRLESVYLKGINAQKNKDWDLSTTAINSNSIAYIIDNLTEWSTFDPNTDTYKNITFPTDTALTNPQIQKLNSNGWKVFAGTVELLPTE